MTESDYHQRAALVDPASALIGALGGMYEGQTN
jgi:hypothetical protein